MADKKDVVKKEITPTERKSVLTAFILLCPSLIIVLLTTKAPIILSVLALFCYQAVLLKSFVDDHYALE